jgi:hypothetical protein
MDPTNFNVETVFEAMAGGLINLSWRRNSKGVQDINRRGPRGNTPTCRCDELDIDVVARLPAVQSHGRAEQLIPVAFIRFGACRFPQSCLIQKKKLKEIRETRGAKAEVRTPDSLNFIVIADLGGRRSLSLSLRPSFS